MDETVHVHLWAPDGLPDDLRQALEAFCPDLDRAAQEVAWEWNVPNVKTSVHADRWDGPQMELRAGEGPAGLKGYHGERGTGPRAYALCVQESEMVVYLDTPGFDALTQVISHELFEWMVNPLGVRTVGALSLEVCDPVSVTPWLRWGHAGGLVSLSNFVYPSYFLGLRDPWDQADVLTRPGHPEPGAYQIVNGVLVQGPAKEKP